MKHPVAPRHARNADLLLALAGVLLIAACATAPGPRPDRRDSMVRAVPEVSPVPEELRQSLNLDPFYRKHINQGGLPILGSTNVTDYAMREAAYIVGQMLALRPEILQVMGTNGARLVVMAHNEYTTDVPEHAGRSNRTSRVYEDRRARGLGGRVSSCAEENLLGFPNDPYEAENILVHEFGHAIASVGMRALDPTFNQRLRGVYEQATNAGLWKGTYAGSNPAEYWAEGVQNWFNDNRENDSLHNHVNTRAELKEYDPALAKLCAEVFGEVPWSYVKPMLRPEAERTHLAGYNPSQAPRFRWRETPIPEKPRVQIITEHGEIEAELHYQQAPITVSNFLKYTLEGFYRDGRFFRTVTLENQPTNSVKIQVIQAEADPRRRGERFPSIPLERTRDTGLTHLDGTLSMARNGPDTARDSFSICIGDQPELDFGGKRNPDGQGFAAFGRVIRGMEVVRKIQAMPADGQRLTPPVRIQGAFRLE